MNRARFHRQRSHAARVHRRSGWSLIEMLVTISLIAILMAPIVAAIRSLLVTQQASTELLLLARAVGEAGRQFARDGERATAVQTADSRVTFQQGAVAVVWDWSQGPLERTEQNRDRQRFPFPRDSRITARSLEGQLVELRIVAPAAQVAVSGLSVSMESASSGPVVAPAATYRLMTRLATTGQGGTNPDKPTDEVK
jgi:prepilin-type N-terminal cleavage/methylation domain-containing protein